MSTTEAFPQVLIKATRVEVEARDVTKSCPELIHARCFTVLAFQVCKVVIYHATLYSRAMDGWDLSKSLGTES